MAIDIKSPCPAVKKKEKDTRSLPFVEVHHIHLAATGAPTLDVTVEFADQASRAFTAYREKYGFGASEMEEGCGDIYNSQGQRVARISYNGRIWDALGSLVE